MKPAAVLFEQSGFAEIGPGLDCVHERQAESVGQMFAPQWKFESVVLDHVEPLRTLVKSEDHRGHALSRRQLPHSGKIIVDHAFLACAEPGELEGEFRHILKNAPRA